MSKNKEQYNTSSIIIFIINIIEYLLFIFLQFKMIMYIYFHFNLNWNLIYEFVSQHYYITGISFGGLFGLDLNTLLSIKKHTKSDCHKFKMHSKHYLHYSKLDFKTPIDDKRIDNLNALSILIELNNNIIPSYLKNKEIYNRLTNLNPLFYQDKQMKQNEINQTNNILNNLKQQILSKTHQIKDILNYEYETNIHKKFLNEYQTIKYLINELNYYFQFR